MSNTYKYRVQHLRGNVEDWEQLGNQFIPLDGELVLEKDNNGKYKQIRVGDGKTPYNRLPKILTDSTISVEINENKQLIITYPDGRVENLGTIGSGNSNVYIGPDKNVPDGFVGLQIDPDGTSYLITDEITATSSNELPTCEAVKNYVGNTISTTDDGYGNITLNTSSKKVEFTDDGNGNIKMEVM